MECGKLVKLSGFLNPGRWGLFYGTHVDDVVRLMARVRQGVNVWEDSDVNLRL